MRDKSRREFTTTGDNKNREKMLRVSVLKINLLFWRRGTDNTVPEEIR